MTLDQQIATDRMQQAFRDMRLDICLTEQWEGYAAHVGHERQFYIDQARQYYDRAMANYLDAIAWANR